MIKFEDVFTFQNLYEAHKRARKCKRHKKEVIDFELNLASNLTNLLNDLLSGTYKIMGYKRFMIFDPKEREIQALSYRDRVVQNCLCFNYMVKVFSRKLIYDNGACQKKKGTHFARARLEGFFRDYYKKSGNNGYILKLDITKFFSNINHEVLKGFLKDVYDEKLKKFIYGIIDSYNKAEGIGVPMGNQTSQIFALLYLNELDRIIKEKFRIKYYIRYMDDIIILHSKKSNLIKIFKYVSKYLEKVKLCLNKKSQIYSLKNGLEFLGVKYTFSKTGKLLKKMKEQSKDRMIKKVKRLKSSFFNNGIEKQDLKMSLAGFNGNVKRMHINGVILKHLLHLKKLAS